MTDCKLYTNFAAVFNKTMFNKYNFKIMRAKNLNNEQLENALNATRMLLCIDREADFLEYTAYKSTKVIEELLMEEAEKRNLNK